MRARTATAAALTAAAALITAPAASAAGSDSWTTYYRNASPDLPTGYYAEGVVDGLGDEAVPLVCNVDSGLPKPPTDDPDEVVLFEAGRWLLRDLGGESTTTFGRAGDTPLCMDVGGDFQDELVIKRGNRYYVADSYAAGGGRVTSFAFGSAGDTPLVGDWDGDGVETVAVKRGNRYYFASDNVDGGGDVVVSSFGSAGDTPIAGFFLVTGEDDTASIGVRRGNRFYVSDDAPGTPVLTAAHSFSFGRATDVALAGQMALETGQQVVVARAS